MGKFELTAGAEIKLVPAANAITVGELVSKIGNSIGYYRTLPEHFGYMWIDRVVVINNLMLLCQRPQLVDNHSKANTIEDVRDMIMESGSQSLMRVLHVKLIDRVYRPVIDFYTRKPHVSTPNAAPHVFMLEHSLGDLHIFE